MSRTLGAEFAVDGKRMNGALLLNGERVELDEAQALMVCNALMEGVEQATSLARRKTKGLDSISNMTIEELKVLRLRQALENKGDKSYDDVAQELGIAKKTLWDLRKRYELD